MNYKQKIAELRAETNKKLEKLPEWLRRKNIAEDAAGKSILQQEQKSFAFVKERLKEGEIIYVPISREIGSIKIRFHNVPIERFTVDSEEVREATGFFDKEVQQMFAEFYVTATKLEHKLVFIRWFYDRDFIDFCGNGRCSLPTYFYSAIPSE
jgi:hypothetical protein